LGGSKLARDVLKEAESLKGYGGFTMSANIQLKNGTRRVAILQD
jgi:hypothetical protein